MSEIEAPVKDMLSLSKFLGLGFYRVNHDGQFVECDARAREIFGIPQEAADLTKYSIKDMYIAPLERIKRIEKLFLNIDKPLCSTLYLQIRGENKLISDICRYSSDYTDGGNFVGFVSPIEESTIFPKKFNAFPMGLYEVNEEDVIVRVNNKLASILKYKGPNSILGKHFNDLCEDKKELEKFYKRIRDHGYASALLRLWDAENKIIEVECFSQLIDDFGNARWGMINDVTERERAVRAVDRMPTGFFHIEYEPGDPNHEHERLTQCNDCFARILGFKNQEEALGINIARDFHPDKEQSEAFLKALYENDKRGEPLRNYTFEIQKTTGEPVYISIDVHLVKDREGKIIAREGTIRDITKEMKLRKEVEQSQLRLEQTTTDINKFIHNFLHPVVKFAGNLELFHQMVRALNQTMPRVVSPGISSEELSKTLMNKVIETRNSLPDIYEGFRDNKIRMSPNAEEVPLALGDLKKNLTRIINIFNHSLNTEKAEEILGSSIRDTALWTLEELNKAGYPYHDTLKALIKHDFIDFLQGIILYHLEQSSQMLKGETTMMKRGVDTLAAYIGLRRERQYTFLKQDMNKVLEENLALFKPVLSAVGIGMEFKASGNLWAEISRPDIDRVMDNLLVNVKKYAFRGKGRFVKLRARELQPQNQVEISIESFGLPIKEQEIRSGAIWEFGFRGELAYAGDRNGIGVGLTDAKEVVEAHNGTISIASQPAAHDGNPPQYKVPYRTTVIITLPKKRKRKTGGIKYGK